MLFSTENGEPLAIFPDGVVQRMRVASSSAIAARCLAREDASTWLCSARLAGGQPFAGDVRGAKNKE